MGTFDFRAILGSGLEGSHEMPNERYDRREFLSAVAAGAAVAAGTSALPASAATTDELCFTSAAELARLIEPKQVSAREVMAAHLDASSA